MTPAFLPIGVGKIERRPLREVWPHEALSFTQWLADNIEVVGEAISVELVSAEREQAAGSFSLDILAEDANGQPVIIENQLGASDHDHLGKVLTYLTAFDAEMAVWIVGEPRPEHVKAIAWLNEASSGAFYLLKLEAIRIGDSPPAPLLTLVVGPSAEARQVGSVKRERSERHMQRHEFWKQLLAHAATKSQLHAHVTPGDSTWASARIGNGLEFVYRLNQHVTGVELYIDRGKDTDAENEVILRRLEQHRAAIEAAYGDSLEWRSSQGTRARGIQKRYSHGGYKDTEGWPEIIDATVDAMLRLEAAVRPFIEQLDFSSLGGE